MRLVVLMVLAGLAALPLGASAQAGEEGGTSEPDVVDAVPTSEPTPEEPALQLKLDDAGIQVAPGYPPRFDEMELRVKRAKIGFGVSAGVVGAGMALLVAGLSGCTLEIGGGTCAGWAEPAIFAGFGVALAAGLAMYATLGTWIHRKRELRRMKEAHYGIPRRVQKRPEPEQERYDPLGIE